MRQRRRAEWTTASICKQVAVEKRLLTTKQGVRSRLALDAVQPVNWIRRSRDFYWT
ncbi:hypothetical protein ABIA39_009016 [Nocardia sp. GAS34]